MGVANIAAVPTKDDSSLTYKSAGVDIDAGNQLVERIKPLAAATTRPGVAADLGGFGALFRLGEVGYHDPVLVSATDGVGTKLKIAAATQNHGTIGIDLVAMCVNDLIVQGAEPLFFLDYFATSQLRLDTAEQIIGGIARGCELAGAALIGGETAEMPDLYAPGEYDLAGFGVGVVEADAIIDGSTVRAGDAVIGLASTGLHSNGFSLVRKILAHTNTSLDAVLDDRSLGDILLEPTRIYVKAILSLLQRYPVHALAHITGGGLVENIPRVLPAGLCAYLDARSWKRPPVFDWLRKQGNIAGAEMLRTFNCGIGMVVVLPEADSLSAVEFLHAQGEAAAVIGDIRGAAGGERVKVSAFD